jgi:RNA polymerase sigma factor (sigma-70 family)
VNKTLNKLLKGLKVRDHKTLNTIYKEYYPRVLGYVVGRGGNDDDAKDIFQESIIIIYKHLNNGQFEIEQEFGSYLVGIAKKLWLKHLRTNDIHERFVQQSNIEEIEDHPSEVELENEVELQLIRKHILNLGEDCRKVLMWSAEGFTNEEIAVKMNYKSEKTVRSKKYKCKSTLLEMIKKDPKFNSR